MSMKPSHKLTTGLLLTTAMILIGTAGADDFRSRVSTASFSVIGLEEDVKAELEFGRDVAARVLSRSPLVKDDELVRYVNLVGRSVASHGSRSDIEYRFAVLDTDSVNAYAAPGGYIFVSRGALALMKDEAELAAVLAHEVAHVTQRHIVKELKIRGTENSPESGLTRILGSSGEPVRAVFAQAVDKAVEVLFESGLKQEDELEADRVGTLILANTGYDPSSLTRYLDKVASQNPKNHAVLSATHPPFALRLSELKKLLHDEQLMSTGWPRLGNRFDTIMKKSRNPIL